MEHDQADVVGQVSEGFRLRPRRNEEVRTPRFDQCFGSLARTQAIAVGLDGGSGRNARMVLQPTPIGLDCGTVDGIYVTSIVESGEFD